MAYARIVTSRLESECTLSPRTLGPQAVVAQYDAIDASDDLSVTMETLDAQQEKYHRTREQDDGP